MRKALLLTLLLTFFAFGAQVELIVKTKQKVDVDTLTNKTGITVLDRLNERYCCSELKPVYSVYSKTARDGAFDRVLLIVLSCPIPDSSVVILEYMDTELFEYVEFNLKLQPTATNQAFYPNDISGSWHLHNEANDPFITVTTREDIDIDMPEAWGIEQGDSSVIVAILDSGIKGQHEDFEGRLWVNKDEIPDNGIDDDGNGYVDDVNGWDFVGGNHSIDDDRGHGTAIASLIGANVNNAKGIAGVNTQCKLMILKITDAIGESNILSLTGAIKYAAEKGADVINISLAGKNNSQAVQQMINYASSLGAVLCSGSGNANDISVYYPAKFSDVIAVGATTPLDERWVTADDIFGSNYGDSLDVVAPGENIRCIQFHTVEDTTYFTQRDLSGTSLATALVSGVASLLISQNPDITPEQVRHIITSTAEDQVGDPAEDTPGYDIYYGHGRINAHQALLLGKQMMETRERGRPTMMAAITSSTVSWSRASNRLTIRNPILRENTKIDLTLVNAAGKVVYAKRHAAEAGIIAVGLPGIAGGMYVYRVKTNRKQFAGKIF